VDGHSCLLERGVRCIRREPSLAVRGGLAAPVDGPVLAVPAADGLVLADHALVLAVLVPELRDYCPPDRLRRLLDVQRDARLSAVEATTSATRRAKKAR
jgi:hypothetical protein